MQGEVNCFSIETHLFLHLYLRLGILHQRCQGPGQSKGVLLYCKCFRTVYTTNYIKIQFFQNIKINSLLERFEPHVLHLLSPFLAGLILQKMPLAGPVLRQKIGNRYQTQEKNWQCFYAKFTLAIFHVNYFKNPNSRSKIFRKIFTSTVEIFDESDIFNSLLHIQTIRV